MTSERGGSALWDDTFGLKDGRRGLRVLASEGRPLVPWGTVLADVARRAAVLRSRGVEPGVTVAGVATNTFDGVAGILAIWWAGGTFASLPGRARGMATEVHAAALRRMVADADAPVLLADGQAEETGAVPWSDLDGGARPIDATPPLLTPMIVQYSSGTTGTPKGCVLGADAVAAQQDLLAEAMAITPGEEVVCSWVPMSHDMGLIGGLVFPLCYDCDLVLSSPERIRRSPRSWFADVSESGAGITTGTDMSLAFASLLQQGTLPTPLRLHSVIVGAEPLRWEHLESAFQAFGQSGLTRGALRPAYGMAETALAVSMSPLTEDPRRVRVDRDALQYQEVAFAEDRPEDDPSVLSITSSGPPLGATTVVVAGDAAVGELVIESPSMASGYLGRPGLTADVFADGAFRSSDRGFVHDGEVYVLGRTDDVVIDGGRNIHLSDIERVIEGGMGLLPGQITLLDRRRGTAAELTAVVELRSPLDADDAGAVGAQVHKLAMQASGVPVATAVFVAKGTLPMTPSGKPQRSRCASLLDRGELEVEAWAGAEPEPVS